MVSPLVPSRRVGRFTRKGGVVARKLLTVIMCLVPVNIMYLMHTRAITDLIAGPPVPELQAHAAPEAPSAHRVAPAAFTIPNADREVDFLDFVWEQPDESDTTSKRGEADHSDAFSAAWWQPTRKFIAMKKFEVIDASPEGASFQVFDYGEKDVRMTRDWLDLGVEHMSMWWKVALGENFPTTGTAALHDRIDRRIGIIFKSYVNSRDRQDFFRALPVDSSSHGDGSLLATKSTLAVVAYMTNSSEKGIWSLAATLMSLVQVGMGRVVVSSDDPLDEDLIRKSFDIVAKATSRWGGENRPWTQFEYCRSANATAIPDPNVPQAVLQRVRHVFEKRTTEDVANCWLGPGGPDLGLEKWKYLFLGEPDLLLTTKPDALLGLGRALAEGRILAPHRLQPLPHASNFVGIQGLDEGRVIPSGPPFGEVAEIDQFSSYIEDSDSTSFDSCCDRGTYMPNLAYEKEDCGIYWWQCGYKQLAAWTVNPQEGDAPSIETAHKRLMGYSLIKLKRGTGVVYGSSERGKTCQPQRGLCKRPRVP